MRLPGGRGDRVINHQRMAGLTSNGLGGLADSDETLMMWQGAINSHLPHFAHDQFRSQAIGRPPGLSFLAIDLTFFAF
jgi:hypothetical protein